MPIDQEKLLKLNEICERVKDEHDRAKFDVLVLLLLKALEEIKAESPAVA